MAAVPDPIILRTNMDWRDAIDLVQVDADLVETPLDLTGATLALHIRRTAATAWPSLVLTTENNRITITDAVNGGIAFDVDMAEIAANLSPGDYVCDLTVKIGDADLVPMVRKITVERGVTR